MQNKPNRDRRHAENSAEFVPAPIGKENSLATPGKASGYLAFFQNT